MLPGRQRNLVTAALMLGNALAALEATAVAAAVPTAVGELGGMSHYSWVFSAYLLASTTTVPLYGKLSDLFGRRRLFHVSVALFLLGSALSGAAHSLNQLILYRALQGLGAGGVQPIALTLIGDIFSLEERGRVQGLFSGVWGAASLLGPPLGGLIADAMSWRWIFYLNVPLGLAASLILQRYLREDQAPGKGGARPPLDVAGTVLLTAAVSALLFALLGGTGIHDAGSGATTLILVAASVLGFALFLWQERRAPDPMLPLDLFRDRIIAVTATGNLVVGALLYAITAFVPMFSQGVIGGPAVVAGAVLTPMLLGWPLASVVSGRMLLRTGYRRLAIAGGIIGFAGSLMLVHAGHARSRFEVLVATFVIGIGVGCFATPSLVAVQSAVPWQRRGVATSIVQFFRTIGGTIAVAALGALFNARLRLLLGGAAGHTVDPNAALDPSLRAHIPARELAPLLAAMASGLQAVFVAMALAAAAALGVALLFPAGLPRQPPPANPAT